MKMIGNVSDWLSYAGGALIKVADSAVLPPPPPPKKKNNNKKQKTKKKNTHTHAKNISSTTFSSFTDSKRVVSFMNTCSVQYKFLSF